MGQSEETRYLVECAGTRGALARARPSGRARDRRGVPGRVRQGASAEARPPGRVRRGAFARARPPGRVRRGAPARRARRAASAGPHPPGRVRRGAPAQARLSERARQDAPAGARPLSGAAAVKILDSGGGRDPLLVKF